MSLKYIDNEFSDQKQPLYNEVKAFPSINSTNNGAVNSEENIRWILNRLTNKPFVVGFNDNDIVSDFIGDREAGYGRYSESGTASMDGYLVKVAPNNRTSYDDTVGGTWSGGSTQGIQRLYTKLTNGLKYNLNEYVFLDYRYVPNEPFPSAWSKLDLLIPNTVGYIGIQYDVATWKEFTDNTYEKYDSTLALSYQSLVTSYLTDNNNQSVNYNLEPLTPEESPLSCVDSVNKTIYYPVYYSTKKRWDSSQSTYVSVASIYFTDIYNVEFNNSTILGMCRQPGFVECSNYNNMWEYTELDSFLDENTTTPNILSRVAPLNIYRMDADYSEVTVEKESQTISKSYIRDITNNSQITNERIPFTDANLSVLMDKIPVCKFNGSNEPVTVGNIKQTGWLPKCNSNFTTNLTSNASFYCVPTTAIGSTEESYKIPENLLRLSVDMNGNTYRVPVVIFRDTMTLMPKGILANSQQNLPLEGYRDFLARNYLEALGDVDITDSSITNVKLSDMISYTGNDFNFTNLFNNYIAPYLNLFLQISNSSTLENYLGIKEIQNVIDPSNLNQTYKKFRYDSAGIDISTLAQESSTMEVVSETSTNITIKAPVINYSLDITAGTITNVAEQINRVYQKNVVHDYQLTSNIVINQVNLNGISGNATYNETIPYENDTISYKYCSDLLDYFRSCRLAQNINQPNTEQTTNESLCINYFVSQLTTLGSVYQITPINYYIDSCVYDCINPENNVNSYISRVVLHEVSLIPKPVSSRTIYEDLYNTNNSELSSPSETNLTILTTKGSTNLSTITNVIEPITPNTSGPDCVRYYYLSNSVPTFTVGSNIAKAFFPLLEYTPLTEISMKPGSNVFDKVIIVDAYEVNATTVCVCAVGWRKVLIKGFDNTILHNGTRTSLTYVNESLTNRKLFPLYLAGVETISNVSNAGQWTPVNGLVYKWNKNINWTYYICYVMTGPFKDSQNYLLGKGFDDNTYYQGIQFHYMFEKDITDKDLWLCNIGLNSVRSIGSYSIETNQSVSSVLIPEKVKHRKESIIHFSKLYGADYRTLQDEIEATSTPEIYTTPKQTNSVIVYVGNHHYYNLLNYTDVENQTIQLKLSPATPVNECDYRNDYETTDGFEFTILVNITNINKIIPSITLEAITPVINSNVPIKTIDEVQYLDLSEIADTGVVKVSFKLVTTGNTKILLCESEIFDSELNTNLLFTDVVRNEFGTVTPQLINYIHTKQVDRRLKQLMEHSLWESNNITFNSEDVDTTKIFVRNKCSYLFSNQEVPSNIHHTLVQLNQANMDTIINTTDVKSLPPSVNNKDFEFNLVVKPGYYNKLNNFIHFYIRTDNNSPFIIPIKTDGNFTVVETNYTYMSGEDIITIENIPTIDIRQLGPINHLDTIVINCKYIDNYLLVSLQSSIAKNKVPYVSVTGYRKRTRLFNADDLSTKFALEITQFESPWHWIQDRINNLNFTNINVSDFIPIHIVDGINTHVYNMRVASIYLYNTGLRLDYSTPTSIDFISDRLWHVKKPLSPINNNNTVIAESTLDGDGVTTEFYLNSPEINNPMLFPSDVTVNGNPITYTTDYTWDVNTCKLTFTTPPEVGVGNIIIKCVSTETYSNLSKANDVQCPWKYCDCASWMNGTIGQGPRTDDPNNKYVDRYDYTESLDSIYNNLPEALKANLSNKYVYVEKRIPTLVESVVNLATTSLNVSSQKLGKLWVPSEVEVFGNSVYADNAFAKQCGTQYPLFKDVLNSTKMVQPVVSTPTNESVSSCSWWLINPAEGSSTKWCCVNNYGKPDLKDCTSTDCSVPICFTLSKN